MRLNTGLESSAIELLRMDVRTMKGERIRKSGQGARRTSMLVVFLVIVGAFAGMVNLMSENVRAQDIWEPDDTAAQASVIPTNGTMQSHYFHIPGDEDWVHFSATSGNQYIVETHNLGASADTYIYLIDTDGVTVLDQDDDGGAGWASRIGWTAPTTGTFYVRVIELGGGGGPVDYDYDINVIESSTGPDAYEPDNSPAEANPILTNGTMQSHTFHIPGDEDWVIFPATEGNEYIIETHNLGASADTYINLYDSNGVTILDGDDDGGVGWCSKIVWLALQTDNLYVRVTELGGGGGPVDYDYDLNVIEVVVGPTFSISNVVPYRYSIAPGEVVAYEVTVTSVAGFTGSVDLSVTDTPPLLFPPAISTFVPSTVLVPSGGSVSSTLTISNTATVMNNNYLLTITGSDGVATSTYET